MTPLKQLRIDRGLTQKFVYEALKMSQSDFSRYEMGRFTPTLETACKIAEFYGLKKISELRELFKKGDDEKCTE